MESLPAIYSARCIYNDNAMPRTSPHYNCLAEWHRGAIWAKVWVVVVQVLGWVTTSMQQAMQSSANPIFGIADTYPAASAARSL